MDKITVAYIARAIARHLNGDIDEFERLAHMAYKHHELETMKGFKIGDVIPETVIEEMYYIATV